MAMLALLNQGNSNYMDALSYWGEITGLQKCFCGNLVLKGMTFHSQLPSFLPLFWKARPSQPTFL